MLLVSCENSISDQNCKILDDLQSLNREMES